MNKQQAQLIVQRIKYGQIGVMPTDTIYGIVADALNESAVIRVGKAKGRPLDKRFIMLISSIDQLAKFNISVSPAQLAVMDELWPGPVSLILPRGKDNLSYLRPGQSGLAFRMPAHNELRNLVAETGPIVATSANKSGQPVPASFAEIEQQLPGLDFYVDGKTGIVPSRIARLNKEGTLEWIERN